MPKVNEYGEVVVGTRCLLHNCTRYPYRDIPGAPDMGSYCELCNAWSPAGAGVGHRPKRPSDVVLLLLDGETDIDLMTDYQNRQGDRG